MTWARLWAWLTGQPRQPHPTARAPLTLTVEEAAAQVLADLQGNPPPVTTREPDGLWRVRLRDRAGTLHGWIRASAHMATQARAAGLPIRPESDFPLTDEVTADA